MLDAYVCNKLASVGFDYHNEELLRVYNSAANQPRVLDKAPGLIKLKASKDVMACGIYDLFTSTFNHELAEAVPCEVYMLRFGNNACYLDKMVYFTLVTLIKFGVNPDIAVSQACSKLLTVITNKLQSSQVTMLDMYDRLFSSKQTDTYETGEIVRAIKDIVYRDESDLIYHWRSISKCYGYYPKAIQLGCDYAKEYDSIKELDKALREGYKLAKEDKDFMASLLKNVCPKPLIGFMYLVKDEHPEVLEPENETDTGFMK